MLISLCLPPSLPHSGQASKSQEWRVSKLCQHICVGWPGHWSSSRPAKQTGKSRSWPALAAGNDLEHEASAPVSHSTAALALGGAVWREGASARPPLPWPKATGAGSRACHGLKPLTWHIDQLHVKHHWRLGGHAGPAWPAGQPLGKGQVAGDVQSPNTANLQAAKPLIQTSNDLQEHSKPFFVSEPGSLRYEQRPGAGDGCAPASRC